MVDIISIINKKKYGKPLTQNEIDYFVQGYTNDEIPDYQISSLLMAILINGMDEEEVSHLTDSMVRSGEIIDLSPLKNIVDKHSTGGIGDKVTLITLPIVAACGLSIAKMSGRGLGYTGGTIDKLESISGFETSMSIDKFKESVEKTKLALVGQTGNLTPADKKLYTLRDVTATVDSIPLIASSIMSKKIASGAQSIVLDVKVGKGAFMKDEESARELANTMAAIGKKLNKQTVVILSRMDEPLGYEVGNANEIEECIKNLTNKSSEPMQLKLCLTLAGYMLSLGNIVKNEEEGYRTAKNALESGAAFNKFVEFVKNQQGGIHQINNTDLLPRAKYTIDVLSKSKGYVKEIDSERIGKSSMEIGAGRKVKGDIIDHSVGISLKKKTGDKVDYGDVVAQIKTNNDGDRDKVGNVLGAFTFSKAPIEQQDIIIDVIK